MTAACNDLLQTATQRLVAEFQPEEIYLFGSHARDEATAGSDIDVFVDPISDERFGFLEFMDAYATIRMAVGVNVELGYSTREGLSRYVRKDIERDAVRVF